MPWGMKVCAYLTFIKEGGGYEGYTFKFDMSFDG